MKNLHERIQEIRQYYLDNFDPNEIILPDAFKNEYQTLKENVGEKVEYMQYTTIVTNKDGQKVFAPNQIFYMAAYLADIVRIVKEYKKLFESCVKAPYKMKSDPYKDLISSLESGKNLSNVTLIENRISSNLPSSFTGTDRTDAIQWLVKFATDYGWWCGQKKINRGDFFLSPVLSVAGLVNAPGEFMGRTAEFFADNSSLIPQLLTSQTSNKSTVSTSSSNPTNLPTLLTPRKNGGCNLIIYGAPGTGKSHYVNNKFSTTSKINRIIFHPESSYADFIGSYKPFSLYKTTTNIITQPDGTPFKTGEPMIDYEFVPGPFISTLVEAWLNPDQMFTLVIEEINRANAAAVFADVFQLLDRDPDGTSEYGLSLSEDLHNYLFSIDGMPQFLDDGLKIPSNMNLVATMNSADQGVSPLDSAFKRRWDFKYLPIDPDNAVHSKAPILYAGNLYYWGDFVKAINTKLLQLGIDEDRLIGTYFIKPGEVGKTSARDKLLLYLWDDVLRFSRHEFFNENVQTFGQLSVNFDKSDVMDVLSNGIMQPIPNIADLDDDDEPEDISDDDQVEPVVGDEN